MNFSLFFYYLFIYVFILVSVLKKKEAGLEFKKGKEYRRGEGKKGIRGG